MCVQVPCVYLLSAASTVIRNTSISIYGHDRRARTERQKKKAEEDRLKGMIRRGQAEEDRQNRTGRTGQVEKDRQNRTGKTGQAEKDWQSRTGRKG